jgi:hypothetical protein
MRYWIFVRLGSAASCWRPLPLSVFAFVKALRFTVRPGRCRNLTHSHAALCANALSPSGRSVAPSSLAFGRDVSNTYQCVFVARFRLSATESLAAGVPLQPSSRELDYGSKQPRPRLADVRELD